MGRRGSVTERRERRKRGRDGYREERGEKEGGADIEKIERARDEERREIVESLCFNID